MPIFVINLGLPKAHVESPVLGSIILSEIILKLGGYGSLLVLTYALVLVWWFVYVKQI